MSEALFSRLSQFTRLSGEETRALETLLRRRVRRLEAREDVVREGDPPRKVVFVLSGWACRYRMLEDGRRQTTAFLLPGDLCDLASSVLRTMDHSIGAVTSVSVAEVGGEQLRDLLSRYPRLSQAFDWSRLVAEAVEREWLVNLGQRTAYERLAHLFCELFVRLQGAGQGTRTICPLPLTQTDLAGSAGMSIVHVNRTLQELRSDKLIEIQNRQLRMLDFERLRSVAMFDPAYLHLDREGRHLDANDARTAALRAAACPA